MSRSNSERSWGCRGGAPEEELFGEEEVGFGIDADGVEFGGFDVEVEAVFEEAELFEAFGAFEDAGGRVGKRLRADLRKEA